MNSQLISKIWLLACGLVAVVTAYLLRPFIRVRFGQVQTSRLGGLTFNLELYVCQKKIDVTSSRTIDILIPEKIIANQYLYSKWSKQLYFFPFALYSIELLKKLPGGRYHIIPPLEFRSINMDVLNDNGPNIRISSEEEKIGRKFLADVKINDHRFICFHARDKTYLEQKHPYRDWSYHDYRDVDIKKCLPAIEEIVSRKSYFALRMGAVVESPLQINNNKIIDYAVKYRSDFLDIYLPSRCHFLFCSSASGFTNLALLFRSPVVVANIVPLSSASFLRDGDLFIPKKFWLRSEKRFMSLLEVMSSPISSASTVSEFEAHGVDVVENTAEEIIELIEEMENRLDKNNQPYEKTAVIQNVLKQSYSDRFPVPLKASMGSMFLRKNYDN